MLQWKTAWSVCPRCRLQLLATAAKNRRTLSCSVRGAARLSDTTRSTEAQFALPRRGFCTSLRRWDQDERTAGSRREERAIDDLVDDDRLSEEDHMLQQGEELSNALADVEEAGLKTENEVEPQDDQIEDELHAFEDVEIANEHLEPPSLEEVAQAARNQYGHHLPENYLTNEEFTVYKRLYGEPIRIISEGEAVEEDQGATSEIEEMEEERHALFREHDDGRLEEVEYATPADEQIVDEDADFEGEEEGFEDEDEILTLNERVAELQLAMQNEPESALTFGDLPEQQRPTMTKDQVLEEIYENWPGDEKVRSHPLTTAGKFGTKPSTLHLPRSTFVEPVQQLLAQVNNKHLIEAAQASLGGIGIPDSPSTPALGRSKGQRPIPITAMQSKMAPMDGNVFISSIMPQVYASVVSVLVECRKRMGSAWLRSLLDKEGGPLILDAGAAGAAIIAIREILRAESDSILEEQGRSVDKANLAPIGRATVVTGSDTLRYRASALLENTTFIPRLPDYVDPTEGETNAQQPRKRYDIIIAPHSLWPIAEDFEKKARVQTLWSLLNPNGGLLILIEKGVPRGFEVIAGARDLLLNKHISSPGSETYQTSIEEQASGSVERFTQKEKGSIIAPCTNHAQCPLYPAPGMSRGRKDWCYFSQRYIRPSYLMTVLSAKARNHDDVEFSYLAVQRGVDQREAAGDSLHGQGFIQGTEATAAAMEGYGPRMRKRSLDEPERKVALAAALGLDIEESQKTFASPSQSIRQQGEEEDEGDSDEEDGTSHQSTEIPHPLSLPRIILNPLKRKGHILLDVCTPAGTFERWMVSRRNSKQVYRDARKAKWGDLWALGARSAEARRVRLGVPVEIVKTKEFRRKRKGRGDGKGKVRFDGGAAVEDEE